MNDSIDSDFSSISPSAMSLLETRSYTSIPFAKESFQIISQFNSKENQPYSLLPKEVILRIIHFETRYRSIDQGLQDIMYNKILEFSSGFSFRGLDLCKNPNIQYIDTDLPNIIEIKRNLVHQLTKTYCNYKPDNLILMPMNALNEEEFADTVSSFNSEPLSIVNEGLLMYLNREQKEILCKIIYKILSQYGGYWITADIYRKGEIEGRNIDNFYKQKGREFLEKHNVENNKFTSFADAEEFFLKCGFKIYKKIDIETKELSSFKLLNNDYPSPRGITEGREKTRETWILKPM